MNFKNFRANIFIRVAIIVGLALLLAFLTQQEMFFAPLATTLALIVLVAELIRYIEKTNKALTQFLFSIRQGSFMERYTSGNRGKQYEELSDALNDVVSEFAKLNVEKELHYQYLQALNENINVAIISFDSTGKLLMMNRTARQLLNYPAFAGIEDFRDIDLNLYASVRHIQPGNRMVVKVFLGEEQFQLNVQVREIALQNKLVRIILLQNLSNELEEKEIDAWHQLMRVLTHEIMNSVTPIVSLTDAIQSIMKNGDGTRKELSTLNQENIEDIFSSLSTIATRSQGLLKFVNAYRAYAKTPEPKLEDADIIALVKRIVDLLTPDLQRLNINLKTNYSHPSIEAKADVALIEQVLINMVKNAMEAVPHDNCGEIDIEVRSKPNRIVSITVADNGPGIDPETITRIFIPFFTTKEKGTGIGLSLSRQIMKLHNGSIRVNSTPGAGSEFTIEWG